MRVVCVGIILSELSGSMTRSRGGLTVDFDGINVRCFVARRFQRQQLDTNVAYAPYIQSELH